MNQIIELKFDYQNTHYKGEAVQTSAKQGHSSIPAFDIFLDNEYSGTIIKTNDHWTSDNHFDSGLIAIIGSIIIHCSDL